MEISSHYYGILALCAARGIKKEVAYKIAYASQFVDDAKINKINFTKRYAEPVFQEEADGKCVLYNISTCHSYFKIKTFNYQAMILNTAAFHFFPRNNGNTFTKKMRCKENPPVLKKLITEAAAEKEFIPEKFGMLLHIYADTFAHQGFSGILSQENDIDGVKPFIENSVLQRILSCIKNRFTQDKFDRKLDKVLPAYGHAQAFNNPDVPYAHYKYTYDCSDDFRGEVKKSDADNRERFKRAFTQISECLDKIQDKNIFETVSADKKVKNLEQVLSILKQPAHKKKKIKLWKKFIKNIYNINSSRHHMLNYNERSWPAEVFQNYKYKHMHSRVLPKLPWLEVTPNMSWLDRQINAFRKFIHRKTDYNIYLVDDYREKSWFRFISAIAWYKKEVFKRLKDDKLDIPI